MAAHEFKESSLSARSYISVRHYGPYNQVNSTWARLTQFAFDRGLAGPSTIAFGFCYDCQPHTDPEQIRYDACLGVDPTVIKELATKMTSLVDADLVNIRLHSMEAERTVMTVHHGPYNTLRDAYTDALHASATGGLKFDAHFLPTLEIYRNNPLLTKPENLVTEIHFLSKGSAPRID